MASIHLIHIADRKAREKALKEFLKVREPWVSFPRNVLGVTAQHIEALRDKNISFDNVRLTLDCLPRLRAPRSNRRWALGHWSGATLSWSRLRKPNLARRPLQSPSWKTSKICALPSATISAASRFHNRSSEPDCGRWEILNHWN